MNWNPNPLTDGDNARETRVSKLVTLEVSNMRGDRSKVVVRNLSPHGIGARSEINVLQCERVTVHLPDGTDIGATIRWVGKGTFGIALDDRIEPDMLKPGQNSAGSFEPRDSQIGFQRIRHTGTTARTGFQRTHREEVLFSSHWTGLKDK